MHPEFHAYPRRQAGGTGGIASELASLQPVNGLEARNPGPGFECRASAEPGRPEIPFSFTRKLDSSICRDKKHQLLIGKIDVANIYYSPAAETLSPSDPLLGKDQIGLCGTRDYASQYPGLANTPRVLVGDFHGHRFSTQAAAE